MKSTTPDLLVLDNADNVGTALRALAPDVVAVVAGAHGPLPALTLRAPIPFGHKAALWAIPQGELVVKHGHPIGRVTADIAAGEHVHVHNVISLSRETDTRPPESSTINEGA